jgi:hypothetical protein
MQVKGFEPLNVTNECLRLTPLTAREHLLPIYYVTKSLSQFLFNKN